MARQGPCCGWQEAGAWCKHKRGAGIVVLPAFAASAAQGGNAIGVIATSTWTAQEEGVWGGGGG
jgi:hypothetical protein